MRADDRARAREPRRGRPRRPGRPAQRVRRGHRRRGGHRWRLRPARPRGRLRRRARAAAREDRRQGDRPAVDRTRLVDAPAAVRPDPARADRVRLHPGGHRRDASASIGRWTSTSWSPGCGRGAFDDLLFPADPVGDAPRIIATLRQLFPMRRNTLTIGPMVDVHWGKPVIITARLAVLIQLDNALGGGPLALSKVVVVGQLRAAVGPTEEDPDARVLRAHHRRPRLLGPGREALRVPRGAARLQRRRHRPHRRPGRLGRVRRPPVASSSPPAVSTPASRTSPRRWAAPSPGSERRSRSVGST